MLQWWAGLTWDNQLFYGSAALFSALFLWQFIASLLGLGDHGDIGADTDVAAGAGHDVADASAGFHYISIRSVLSFLMMFSWSGALYRNNGTPMAWTLGYSLLWGLAGMFVTAFLVRQFAKLQESGNTTLAGCVGQSGSVYLDIPADGIGEVRVMVCSVMSTIKARSADRTAIKAGTPVVVTRVLDPTLLEVKPVEQNEGSRT